VEVPFTRVSDVESFVGGAEKNIHTYSSVPHITYQTTFSRR